MVKKLSRQEIDIFLQENPNWTLVKEREAVEIKYVFKNFKAAFAFMTQMAMHAEQMCHHPEWFNVYNQVHVVLTTHDCDGLSEKDIKMAKIMDKLAA